MKIKTLIIHLTATDHSDLKTIFKLSYEGRLIAMDEEAMTMALITADRVIKLKFTTRV